LFIFCETFIPAYKTIDKTGSSKKDNSAALRLPVLGWLSFGDGTSRFVFPLRLSVASLDSSKKNDYSYDFDFI
jgi:hypothetical protein